MYQFVSTKYWLNFTKIKNLMNQYLTNTPENKGKHAV